MNLLDRLFGRTGAHRRTYPVWQAMETRVADMDAQDALIADLVRQRDHARSLAAAAGTQVEDFRQRVNVAETAAAEADLAATRLRSQVANLKAFTVPLYADGATTQELHLPITEVMSLQARGAA